MKHPLSVLSVPSILASFFASALTAQTVIRVPADAATIQEGIALAVNGDTVRVAPGTYHEAIEYLGKAIVLESEGGAALTTIDATGLFESVVRFHAGEGPGSVLRGFTVTGGAALSSSSAGGISGHGFGLSGFASPRIERCVVRANNGFNGWAGGISGNGTIEDCIVEENSSSFGAGGIAGAPIVRRCTIRNNRGYDGGGLWLFGGRVEDTRITGNLAQEGTKGGGVYVNGASVVLLRCLIAGNTSVAYDFYAVASSGIFADTGGGAALVASCTIADNRMQSPDEIQFNDCGGVSGPLKLVNTIVRGNDGTQLIPGAGFAALFSNLQGGFAGPGNFDLDPLFVDPATGDYRLLAGSPCIDAGFQGAPPDPDCTRADVGAFYFAQPCVETRNGSGVNPSLLAHLGEPRLGSVFTARIDAGAFPGAAITTLMARDERLEPGTPTRWGELLVGGATLFTRTRASTGAFDDFSFTVPNDPALIAREVHLQAALYAPLASTLTNALVLHVGQ